VGYKYNGHAYRDRCADRNHQSSAQIERDFSAASLVLLSNRGSIYARYFQAQLCSLVNFLHLVHPEDMSPKSMVVAADPLLLVPLVPLRSDYIQGTPY